MKYLICLVLICLVLTTGCTSCVKNECKKVITPASMNEYSLVVVDTDGVRYDAKDIYVFNQLEMGKSKMVTYIDGNPKLLVTVY
jgi:hypothetical protein